MSEAGHILLYGVIAALSPTVLLATLAVLGSGRGRLNGIVFLAAFLAGQSLAYIVCFFVGSAVSPDNGESSTAIAALELAAGIALVAIGLRHRRRSRDPELRRRETRMSQRVFARLTHVAPAVSFGVGMPLGIGVKRLVITLLAATVVAVSGLSTAENVALSLLYVVVATIVVWVPVLVYLVLGTRADSAMTNAKDWITDHEDGVTIVSALLFGVFFVVDAVVTLR